MSDNPHANTPQSSRLKWGLVLGLSLLLGYLVFRSDEAGPTSRDTPSSTAARRSNGNRGSKGNRASTGNEQAGVQGTLQTERARAPSPVVQVEDVLRYNPFEYTGQSTVADKKPPPDPDDDSQTTTARRQQQVQQQKLKEEQLKAQRRRQEAEKREQIRQDLSGTAADIILESSRGSSARIGDSIVHEGNQFRQGTTVRQIGPKEVILELPPVSEPLDSPNDSPQDK